MIIVFNSFTIDKVNAAKFFEVSASVNICIDGFCETIPVFTQLLIPIPFCNTNGTLALPGGSVLGYLEQLATDTTEGSVNLVLEALGIKV